MTPFRVKEGYMPGGWSAPARYGVAVLAIGVVVVAKLLLAPAIDRESPFLLFFGAIIVGAWFGGRGPGILAAVLAAVAADYFFLFPTFSLRPDGFGQGLRLALFLVEGIFIGMLTSATRSAGRRSETIARQAREDREWLRESEERYRLLVENARDYAMFTVGTDGRVEDWSTGAERIFGYREEEAIGQHSSFVFTPEDVRIGAPEEELKEAEATGRAEDERWHTRKDGTRFFASGVVTPLRDDAGELRGFAKVARDVTERKRAEEEAERLHGEKSEIARVLQAALLPPRLPEVPGVELAARYVAAGEGVEVGGDFYDVFPTADGAWTVVLGDVSGKGPEAAVLTSLAHYTLRATATRVLGPGRVLGSLNAEILSQTEGERFFSVALGRLRLDRDPHGEGPRGASLTTVRAGHPAPLLLRAAPDGEAAAVVEELGEPGTVLGIRPDPRLPESVAQLRPGDAAVFYTDGVTEARSPEGGFFGEDGLRALLEGCAGLSAEEIAERLKREVLAYQSGAVRDDAAILVLRILNHRDGP